MNKEPQFNRKIVLATKNQGKVREFTALFSKLGVEIISLKELEKVPDVIEDGNSFEENAKKKAETICLFTGIPTIADDSGLVVDELGGAPGIFSARYAGEKATDDQNNHKLLRELTDVPIERRSAHYVAYLAFAVPGKKTIGVEDTVEGLILETPKGQNGFGYDPLFLIPEYEKTMAEIEPEVKNQISHRGKAMRRLFELLKNLDLLF
ncbi:XTP/dITP diphosphatase [Tepidibacillus marianensis]|uniref:XTP/dITP diphosphatase n=1 Tax=Tepidibacillus marianensis TaxID=3131995 RepID=UPI0030D24315